MMDEIVESHVYQAKVAAKLVPVRILAAHTGGWIRRNEATGREVRIKTVARLREEITMGRTESQAERRIQNAEFYTQSSTGARRTKCRGRGVA